MIRDRGVIFENESKKHIHKKKKKVVEDLVGDSGVGQASESPIKFSKKEKSSVKNPQSVILRLDRRIFKNVNDKILAFARMTRASEFSSGVLSHLGAGLILFSIIGILVTYGPILKVEFSYRLSRLFAQEKPARGSFADVINAQLAFDIDQVPDPNFSLIIPKISAKGKVIANVDPSDYGAYMDALKTGIAHAAGTAFPGSTGNIYLFAHSTDSSLNILRYNAVFYLLRELEPKDEVYLYFTGAKHRYVVTEKKIVEPTDVTYLTAKNEQNKEVLILQTCWPPGTTLKRLLIFAEKPAV